MLVVGNKKMFSGWNVIVNMMDIIYVIVNYCIDFRKVRFKFRLIFFWVDKII